MIHDIYGAKRLGMRTILVKNNTSEPSERKINCPAVDPLEPDAVITSIDGILDVIDGFCR